MKNFILLTTILFFSFTNKNDLTVNSDFCFKHIDQPSSTLPESTLYKGTLNGTIGISLYLKIEEHPCGGDMTIMNAMYKYDTPDKWILLSITEDQQKEKYAMVEDKFTGVLFLEKKEGTFNGVWISPDAKKQFKVELEKVELNKSTAEELDEMLFDDLLYNKNDC